MMHFVGELCSLIYTFEKMNVYDWLPRGRDELRFMCNAVCWQYQSTLHHLNSANYNGRVLDIGLRLQTDTLQQLGTHYGCSDIQSQFPYLMKE